MPILTLKIYPSIFNPCLIPLFTLFIFSGNCSYSYYYSSSNYYYYQDSFIDCFKTSMDLLNNSEILEKIVADYVSVIQDVIVLESVVLSVKKICGKSWDFKQSSKKEESVFVDIAFCLCLFFLVFFILKDIFLFKKIYKIE